METTLRMFYALALFALCFFFLVVMVAFAGVAAAQEAGPIAVDQIAPPAAVVPAPDLLSLAFSTASAFVVAAVGALLTVALRHAPAWVTAIVDHLTTSEAVKWETLLSSGLDRAEAYARSQIGEFTSKNRNEVVTVMAGFLNAFNPEIVRWADQNKNGVFDLIESRLPPTGPRTTPAAVAPLKRKSEVN